MARCFLTGVEFHVEDGYVLNRTDAYRLLRTLKNRAESLERLIAQLAPMDERVLDFRFGTEKAADSKGRKHHRMICKAVAIPLAATYPEIDLLLSWAALASSRAKDRISILKQHPVYGVQMAGMAETVVFNALNVTRRICRMIDPQNQLSPNARLAISTGVCLHQSAERPEKIAAMLRAFVEGDSISLFDHVPAEELLLVRASLEWVLQGPRRKEA